MRAPMTAPGTAATAMYSRSSARRWLRFAGLLAGSVGRARRVHGRPPRDQGGHDEAQEDRDGDPQGLETHVQVPDRDDRVEGELDDGAGRDEGQHDGRVYRAAGAGRRGRGRAAVRRAPCPAARPRSVTAQRLERPAGACRPGRPATHAPGVMEWTRPRHGTAARLEASLAHDDTNPRHDRQRPPGRGRRAPRARGRGLHRRRGAGYHALRGTARRPTVRPAGGRPAVTPVPDITPKPGVSRVPGLPGSPDPGDGEGVPPAVIAGGRGRRGGPGRRGCGRGHGGVRRVRDLAQRCAGLPEARARCTRRPSRPATGSWWRPAARATTTASTPAGRRPLVREPARPGLIARVRSRPESRGPRRSAGGSRRRCCRPGPAAAQWWPWSWPELADDVRLALRRCGRRA